MDFIKQSFGKLMILFKIQSHQKWRFFIREKRTVENLDTCNYLMIQEICIYPRNMYYLMIWKFVRFLKNDITLCFSDFSPQIFWLFFEKAKVALFLKGRVYCRKSHHFFDFSIITFCGQKHVLSFFNISIFSPGYRAFIKGRVTVLKGLSKRSTSGFS